MQAPDVIASGAALRPWGRWSDSPRAGRARSRGRVGGVRAALAERATGRCRGGRVGVEVVDVLAGHAGTELDDVFFPGAAQGFEACDGVGVVVPLCAPAHPDEATHP